MDELSLLEAGSIDAIEALESAPKSLPASDFTGSLDYIDSLASRSLATLNRREAVGLTTAATTFDYLSPLVNSQAVPGPTEQSFSVSTDMRPLQDARTFSFTPRGDTRPIGLIRSSSEVVASRPIRDRIATPDRPYTPLEVEEILHSQGYRDANRSPFKNYFRKPDQVVTCLKRRIRKNVMHAFGFAGLTGFRRPRRTFWSRVIC